MWSYGDFIWDPLGVNFILFRCIYSVAKSSLSHSPYRTVASSTCGRGVWRRGSFLIESNFLFGSMVGCEVSLLFRKLKVIPLGDQKRQNKSKRDWGWGVIAIYRQNSQSLTQEQEITTATTTTSKKPSKQTIKRERNSLGKLSFSSFYNISIEPARINPTLGN